MPKDHALGSAFGSFDPEAPPAGLDPYDPEAPPAGLDPYDPEAPPAGLDPYDPEAPPAGLDPYDPDGTGWSAGSSAGSSAGPSLDLAALREKALRLAQLGHPYRRPAALGAPAAARPSGAAAANGAVHPACGYLPSLCACEAPEKPAVRAFGEGQQLSGAVVVRLSPLVPLEPGDDSLADVAARLDLTALGGLLVRFGDPTSARAIAPPGQGCSAVRVREVLSLEKQARRNGLRGGHSLTRYFRLEAGNLALVGNDLTMAGLRARLLEELNALPEVDLAYPELAASDPDVAGDTADGYSPVAPEYLSDFQFSFGRAPGGLNAAWARERLNGGGENILLGDVEQGWRFNHEELADDELADHEMAPKLVHGHNADGFGDYRGDHGTAVLSQLIANGSNGAGLVGMAKDARGVVVSSHFIKGEGALASNGWIAAAITGLTTGPSPKLKVGDVLLLEVQLSGQPAEVQALEFDAIRLATANGIIVVEAAGNGGWDLDTVPTSDGRSLDRRSPYFRDSGAIVVGAARSAPPHDRARFSSYGSRVDCFSWGEGVVAAGYGDFQDGGTTAYTDEFSGTSSAAAQIAGVARLLQGLYRTHAAPHAPGLTERWKRLSPGQMRSLLSNPLTGTRQGRRVPGWIGIMPNLNTLADAALGLVPQLYLRDRVGDDGDPLRRGREFCSPDLFVRAGKTDPRELGEGSGTENLETLHRPPNGGPAFVHVRTRNRGLKAAEEVRIAVYRAPICTLVTPNRWRALGTATLKEVGQGDTLTVSEPIAWPADAPLTPAQSSLVAVVGYAGGPETPESVPTSAFQWSRFLSLVRRARHVAWNNVHPVALGGVSGSVTLDFKINGAPDAPRAFELEVLQKLPAGAHLKLTTGIGLALKLAKGRLWTVTRQKSATGAQVGELHLPTQARFPLGAVTLPAAVDFASTFTLDPATVLGSGHSLAIRQLYQGQEVGRITWRFERLAEQA